MADDTKRSDGGATRNEGVNPSIGHLRVRRSYEVLADYLREQILKGEIEEGGKLLNERDLGDRTGLSRGSVREALRILEVEGLVTTRPGARGGRVIKRPSVDGVSRSLELFIRGQGISFDSVLQTRNALEPALASLAALNRNDDDLHALVQASRAVEDGYNDVEQFLIANTNWHFAVTTASHNELMIALTSAIGQLLHKSNIEDFISDEVRTAVVVAHRRIQDAIVARDPQAAHRRMVRHLQAYAEQVRPLAPATIDLNKTPE